MGRTVARISLDQARVLWTMRKACPACCGPMRQRYENQRTLVTLSGAVRLRLKVRRCEREGLRAPPPAVPAGSGKRDRFAAAQVRASPNTVHLGVRASYIADRAFWD